MGVDLDHATLYMDFVAERHKIWAKRQKGSPQPWTDNRVLANRKFTNVFRVLDPGSQFVFQLDHEDPVEALARIFLYRHTNLPSAWEAYREITGSFPELGDLDNLLEFWEEYRAAGNKLFSGAYMVYPQSSEPGTDKAKSVVELTKRLFLKEGLGVDFLTAEGQAERFFTLRRNKGVADFMSMQILTDYGYTRHGSDVEDEFVVCGPGAKRGAAHIAPGRKPNEAIEWAIVAVHQMRDCPELPNARKPSKMDIQNTFCEFSKYVRHLDSRHRGSLYRPAHPGVQLPPKLPLHWNR